jgi:nucleoside-diphosphate-sugar epimerase
LKALKAAKLAHRERQREDNCEFRIANCGFKSKETGVRRSSKLKGGIVETIETFRKASGRVYENNDLG